MVNAGSDFCRIHIGYTGDSLRESMHTIDCYGSVGNLTVSMIKRFDSAILAFVDGIDSPSPKLHVWDVRSWGKKNTQRWEIPAPLIEALVVSSDNKFLIGSENGNLLFFDLQNGEIRETLAMGSNERIAKLQFNHSGDILAVVSAKTGIVNLWDIDSRTLNQSLNNEGPVGALEFSQDDRVLAVGDAKNGSIKVWARPES